MVVRLLSWNVKPRPDFQPVRRQCSIKLSAQAEPSILHGFVCHECSFYAAVLLIFLCLCEFVVCCLRLGKAELRLLLAALKSHRIPLWEPLSPFTAPPSDGQGARLSQVASLSLQNVSFVGVCGSSPHPGAFSPGRMPQGCEGNYCDSGAEVRPSHVFLWGPNKCPSDMLHLL